MTLHKIKEALRDDRAENSIMQTITIAVSAILIAAGLMTAPGLIINARDNNARTDLANLAYAQEWALANNTKYYENVQPGEPNSLFDKTTGSELSTGISYTLSGGVENQSALVCKSGGWHYLMKATSGSGKTFYITDGSSAVSTDLGELDIAQCLTNSADYSVFVS